MNVSMADLDLQALYSPKKAVDIDKVEGIDRASAKQTVGSKKSNNIYPMGTEDYGMENRDPNNLNAHVQVKFEDVIGEPDGLVTPEFCWDCSVRCYDGTRQCCYVLLVVLFAPFIAFCNGCQFACLACTQVWCVGPCLRIWKINCATFRRFWWGCLLAICGPCAEVFGLYFSKIKVRYQRIPDGEEKDTDADDYFNV